jgi:hypothetical protein
VLIVDRSSDNREVLTIGLSRHGLTTLGTGQAVDAARVMRELQADLVLVDADTGLDAADTAPVQPAGSSPAQGPRWLVVAKPYHYRPLIRRIVEMLRDDG